MRAEPWIAALKVGDEVLIERGGWSRHQTLATVTKVYPSGRIACGSDEFNPDGRRRGGSSSVRSRLVEATPARLEAIAHASRVSRLRFSVKWESLSPAKASEICAILDRPEQEPT